MFRRIGNLVRGFLGLFIGGLEKRNPEALLEVEKENLRKQIAQYNQGLASHAGMCERLITQVKRLETEERELRAQGRGAAPRGQSRRRRAVRAAAADRSSANSARTASNSRRRRRLTRN